MGWAVPNRARPSCELLGLALQAPLRVDGMLTWAFQFEDRGFALISRRPHPEMAVEVCFIEAKGRAGLGETSLKRHLPKRSG